MIVRKTSVFLGVLFLSTLYLMAGTVQPARALDCVDYRDFTRVLAKENVLGQGNDVVQRDGIAYVGTNGSLKIMDVGDPEAPIILAEVGETGSITASLHGDYAYVTYVGNTFIIDDDSGFQIVDISDPAAPLVLATVDTTPVLLGRSARVGDYLLISSINGLRVYDVSDPAAPALAGEFPAIAGFFDIKILGDLAYLSGSLITGLGIQVVDISVPTAPVLLTTVPTTDWPKGMELSGDLLLVAEHGYSDGQLLLFDLSTPSAPVILGSITLDGQVRDVCLKGNTAFVATYSRGLQLVDLSDPSQPELLGRLSMGVSRWPVGVARLDDNILVSTYNDSYNASSSQFTVVSAVIPGFVPVFGDDIDHAVEAMVLEGDIAYLAAGADGVVAMDVSDPENPQQLSELVIIGEARDLGLALHYAYVAAGSGGIRIVDVADPGNLTVASGLGLSSVATDIFVDFPVAYLALQSGDLVAVDISNTYYLSVLDILDVGGYGDISVHGNALYYATNGGAVHVVDISDPAALTLAGDITFDDWTAIDNLLVADEILIVGTHWQFDDYFGSTVQTFDLADPLSPISLDSHPITGFTQRSMTISGTTIYVQAIGVHLVDFSDPTELSYIGMLSESPWAMAAADDRLVMVGRDGDAPEPLLTAPLHCVDLTAVGEDDNEAPAFARLTVYPNPFNPKTIIRFRQPTTGSAQLAVYGLDGRLVRTLLRAVLPAGEHEEQWDGRNDAGLAQSSGVYLIRYTGPGVTAREKLVLLR